MRRKLAAGNWKMNGLRASLGELTALGAAHPTPQVDLLLCLPATLITEAASLCAPHGFGIGAQDCHIAPFGAHTGDLSAPMLADAGASAVILGHSERRTEHHESSDLVRAKASAAHAAGLMTLICVGESLPAREAQKTLDIIAEQVSASVPDGTTGQNTVIAYEPVWAIGTGQSATGAQIAQVHDFIRARLGQRFGAGIGRAVRLLYGGSVNPANAAQIFAVSNVDGALVGGASLKATDFTPIVTALENSP